jgi:Ca2+-binding RTX toxin-like protein/phospholipase/lecithinase/hemolysin
MAYTAVHVFGDSLVDAGNALKLAQTYNSLPFAALPDGAPTAGKGYFEGRFTNGYTFADLITNKYVGVPSKPVFPFGYEEPWLGLSLPFVSEPTGSNLNWAYGGAQIIQGNEAVPDMDSQTDAHRDAVDGAADPTGLHLVTFGGNDVRELVGTSGSITAPATAQSALQAAAAELFDELQQLISIGARHILVTGVPDVGIIPYYNGLPDEALRRAAASSYSDLLDRMIQEQVGRLQASYPSVDIHYVSFDAAMASILPYLQAVYGYATVYPLEDSELVFFDHVHPTAQAHALLAGYLLDSLSPSGPAGEAVPLVTSNARYSGTIGAAGEVDTVTLNFLAGYSYTVDVLGLSSGVGSLPDPLLTIADPSGQTLLVNDDGGLGLDAHLVFNPAVSGDYSIKIGAIGSVTGSYVLQVLSTEVGDRTILGTVGNDSLFGGNGSDTLWGAAGSDILQGGAGADELRGQADIDTISGDEGDDALFGGPGDDVMLGGTDVDFLSGGADNDRLDGGPGADELRGQNGNDTLHGSWGSDNLFGGPGADNLDGGDDDDFLRGGADEDVLLGGGGNDVLYGALGPDTLIGGLGSDTFLYERVEESTGVAFDLIEGFSFSDDRIDLPVRVAGLSQFTAQVSAASFDSDLAAVIGGHFVSGSSNAAWLKVVGGGLSGRTFLTVDVNGDGAYQAGADIVIEIAAALGALPTAPEFLV